MACLRSEVLAKYGLTPDMLTRDLRVSQRTAAALSRPDVRDLVPEDDSRYDQTLVPTGMVPPHRGYCIIMG